MKRILILGFAGALAAAACGPPSPRELGVSSTPSADSSVDTSSSPARQGPPDCGKTNIASDEYGTEINPTSGPAGTEVTFSGTTLRGENWEWAPSDRLEAWWNTDVPSSEVSGGKPVAAGPVVRLVRVDDMERCRFETTFTVPDVEPGRYKISVFSWFANPEDGYGLFLPHHFTVTSVPSQCPRVGEGEYAIDLSADSGPPGAAVTVSGATPVYAEDGSYVGPDGEIQFWWNADPDYWHNALPGPPDPVPQNRSADVASLGAVQLSDCTFEFEFEVPDVAPGDYPILPLALNFKDSGAWDSATFHAAYAPVFRVTEHQ